MSKSKGRWKKGESGNPNGRARDFAISDSLRIQIRRTVIYKKNGDKVSIVNALPKKHTFADLIGHQLVKGATAGNIACIREIFSRLEGIPDANVTVTNSEGTAKEPLSVQETLAWIKSIIERDEAKDAGEPSLH